MRTICAAVCEDARQRENLCQCVNILGGVPLITGNTVSVEYEGTLISKFVELFEQYPTHEIRFQD